MLKKHKTFDLNRQRDQRKRDRMYGRKKWKYLKYIIVPAIIAFILLCILAHNINYTKDISKKSSNKALNKNVTNSQDNLDPSKTKHYDTDPTKIIVKKEEILPRTAKIFANTENNTRQYLSLEQVNTELQMINSELLIEDAQTSWANAIICQEYKDNCTLSCSGGTVSFVDENLQDFQLKCPGVPLNLMVEKCEFNFGTLQQSFFHGAFKLASLSISECNLKIIKAAAFKHTNVQNLHTLILRNNQLANLQDTSFEGLANLLHFEFVQAPLSEPFKGEGFLKPLIKSLNKAIVQPLTNGSDVMVPLDWWPALLFTSLTYLDLSNTNLQGALDGNTFQPFEAVEYLILYNCNLIMVMAETFDFISSSLKYLDLRYNQLQILDSEFLQMFATNSIEMDLSLNDWYCECDQDMLQYFMHVVDVQIAEGIICSTPEKWQQMELLNVIRECGVIETTTKMTSTINTTTEMTTSSITEAKPITTTTEYAITIPTTTQYTPTTFSQQPPSTTKKTTSNPSTTTTIFTSTSAPSKLMPIKCYLSDQKTKTVFLYINQPSAKFVILTNSLNSLNINLQEVTHPQQMYSTIYFTNYSDYKNAYLTTDSNTLYNTVFINDLTPSHAYVFCLLIESVPSISPFDCRSHFLESLPPKTKWLLTTDKGWLIAVITFIALLLCFISIFLVYILLRSKPQWLLNDNKRILPVRNSSTKVLIVSKNSRSNGTISSNPPHLSQTSNDYLKSLPFMPNPGAHDIENSVYSAKHSVPTTRAPKLPPIPNVNIIPSRFHRTSCSPVTKCRQLPKHSSRNMDYLDIIEDDPAYQTIDHYEAIN